MNANSVPQAVRWQDDAIASPTSQRCTPAVSWMGRFLASSATVLSLAVSGLVGWQRGSTPAAQLLLAAIGILAVLGGHWLLPLLRAVQAGFIARLIGLLLWLACLIYAAMSHADFFIDVQAQRSEHRVMAMEVANLSPDIKPKRSLPAILEEASVVRVKWMQARHAETNCEANCAALNLRQVALKSRVATLEAEEEEIRRWQVTQDQLQRRREGLREDPVTSRLQRDFGVTSVVASLVTVLPVAIILEGLGALCWFMVLHGCRSPATSMWSPAVVDLVTGRVEKPADGEADASPMTATAEPVVMTQAAVWTVPGVADVRCVGAEEAPTDVRALAAKVWIEVQQGRLRPTVSSIRKHLRVAQVQAGAVARIIRGWEAGARTTVATRPTS